MAEVIEIQINGKDNTSAATNSARANFQRLGREITGIGNAMTGIFTRPLMELERLIMKNKEVQAALAPIKEAWAGLANELAVSLLPVIKELTPALVSLAGSLSQIITWFSGLSVGQKEVIIGFVGLVAALGPFLTIVGQALIFLTTLNSAFTALSGLLGGGVLTGGIAAFGSALAAAIGPALAISAAILAVGYAVVKLVQFLGMLGDMFNKLMASGKMGEFLKAIMTPGALWNAVGATASWSNFKLPGRAMGGPVMKGKAYMTGENGPEPFIPKSDGTILPTSSLAAAGGGGLTFVYSPGFSFASPSEIQRVAPIIRNVMRGH